MNSTTETTPPAVRTARDHCLAPERVDAPIENGRYRSLFPDLPALEVDEAALHALGRPGGPCDLGIDFADDADARVAAVWPFFGQFVAHDITADRSPVTHRADADRIRNFRAPRANLEGALRRRAGRLAVPVRARTTRPSCCCRPTGDDVPAQPRGDRADRRSAQRRAPVHQPDGGRLHQAAQPAGRPPARRRRRRGGRSSRRRGGPPPGTTST